MKTARKLLALSGKDKVIFAHPDGNGALHVQRIPVENGKNFFSVTMIKSEGTVAQELLFEPLPNGGWRPFSIWIDGKEETGVGVLNPEKYSELTERSLGPHSLKGVSTEVKETEQMLNKAASEMEQKILSDGYLGMIESQKKTTIDHLKTNQILENFDPKKHIDPKLRDHEGCFSQWLDFLTDQACKKIDDFGGGPDRPEWNDHIIRNTGGSFSIKSTEASDRHYEYGICNSKERFEWALVEHIPHPTYEGWDRCNNETFDRREHLVEKIKSIHENASKHDLITHRHLKTLEDSPLSNENIVQRVPLQHVDPQSRGIKI